MTIDGFNTKYPVGSPVSVLAGGRKIDSEVLAPAFVSNAGKDRVIVRYVGVRALGKVYGPEKLYAGVANWLSNRLPSYENGFDSRLPLHAIVFAY